MRAAVVLGLSAAILLPAGPAGADLDLWPLLVASEDETVVLYPFYVRERQAVRITDVGADRVEVLLGREADGTRRQVTPGEQFAGYSYEELASRSPGPLETPDFLMVFPWYYRTSHGQDHHVLWPIFKQSRGRVERVAPFWFGGENRFTLLPIIHRTPELTLWGVPPTMLLHGGATTAVFPFFIRMEHELYVAPSYYHSSRPGEATSDVLFPLWFYHGDDEGYTLDLLILFGWQRRPDVRSEWAFPFYYDRRQAERRVTGLLFPLYYRDRGVALTRTWLLPVLVERGTRASRTWVVPFWMRTREQRAAGETRSWLSILWPLYSLEAVRSADGELLERRRRFLVFGDRLERDGRRTLSILGVPVREDF